MYIKVRNSKSGALAKSPGAVPTYMRVLSQYKIRQKFKAKLLLENRRPLSHAIAMAGKLNLNFYF